MSVAFRDLLPFRNRNLQLTLLVGAAIVSLNLVIPEAAAEASRWSVLDAMKAIVLAGLPTMLAFLGNRTKNRTERIVARGTAVFACVPIAIHTCLAPSDAWQVTISLVLLIWFQVAVMWWLDEGGVRAR